MHTTETYDAFGTLIEACIDANKDHYEILLDGKPIIVGTARVYRTKGAALQAAIRAVFSILWNYSYWQEYHQRIAKRSKVNEELVKSAFEIIKPIYEKCRVGSDNGGMYTIPSNANMKKEARKIVSKMLEIGKLEIRKMK